MKQSVDLSSALERLIAQIKQITTLYESAFQPDTLNAALSRKGQILRSTPNTAPLICGAYNTQPEGLLTTA